MALLDRLNAMDGDEAAQRKLDRERRRQETEAAEREAAQREAEQRRLDDERRQQETEVAERKAVEREDEQQRVNGEHHRREMEAAELEAAHREDVEREEAERDAAAAENIQAAREDAAGDVVTAPPRPQEPQPAPEPPLADAPGPDAFGQDAGDGQGGPEAEAEAEASADGDPARRDDVESDPVERLRALLPEGLAGSLDLDAYEMGRGAPWAQTPTFESIPELEPPRLDYAATSAEFAREKSGGGEGGETDRTPNGAGRMQLPPLDPRRPHRAVIAGPDGTVSLLESGRPLGRRGRRGPPKPKPKAQDPTLARPGETSVKPPPVLVIK